MSYALVDLELSEPPAPLRLGPGDEGIAIVSRWHGRVVGFAMHALAPGTQVDAIEVGALLDPEPADLEDHELRSPTGTDDAGRAASSGTTITVAVCTRDRPDLLARCLESLVDAAVPPTEILVVDNAPTDDRTSAIAGSLGVGYEVEPCPGLDFARNRALRRSRTDVVAFVDDDVVVDRHWREGLEAAWEGQPDLGAVTGQILPLELVTEAQVAFERRGGFRGGNTRICYSGTDLDGNPTYPYSPGMFGAGANMSVRRSLALRLGGFDEALDTGPPLPGGGDIDMMQRVLTSGSELRYEPRLVVFHRHRRDNAALLSQYDSWARSSMAVVAKTYRIEPGARPKLRLYIRWFFLTQARGAMGAAVTGRSAERRAATAELKGGLAGLAGTYRRSQRRTRQVRRTHSKPAVAILPWGHVIEDYLDPIGLSVDSFADDQAGGWLFGFAEALQRAGVDIVIVCWSRSVDRPTRRIHLPTGAALWLLPPARPYSAVRRRLQDPYAWDRVRAGGDYSAGSRLAGLLFYEAAPYLATTPLALARILRREGAKAVLCQEYEEGRFDVCIALGRLLRLPVFATFQGGDHTRTRLERLIRRRAVRSAAGLVVGAGTEADRVRDRYGFPAARIAAIPNPFDPSTVPLVGRDEARSTLDIGVDVRVVVWHGRVDIHPKGIDVLLEAWPLVRRAVEQPTLLLMLGTGSGAGWLKQRIDDLEMDDVRWRDEYVLDREVIGAHLSAADVYVLPSRQEGFPVAPIEAMAAGLPVVAADAPGVRAVVGEGDDAGGSIVPTGDAEALASALRRYLDDLDLATATGAKGRERVAQLFSLDGVGTRLRSFMLGP